MKLSQLVNETETKEFTYDGEVVRVEFFRHASPEARRLARERTGLSDEEIQARVSDGDFDRSLVAVLSLRLVSWDVEADDSGEIVPITEELLARCKDEFLTALMKEVLGFNQIPPEPSPSESGLSRGAAASVQNLSTIS